MRILLLFTLIIGLCFASTADTERRVGANLIVIHEYGSKKIFRQGNLAMGSTKESKTGKLGTIGVREGEINYSYPSKGDLIGLEKVKDVKFYEIMPEKFSYFERGDLKNGIYEGMITSIYFTGEGKLAEGGIHSKKFKNKFNINNFLGWCHKDFIKHCRRLLMAEFDLSNMVYFSVYNPKSANGVVANPNYYANSTFTTYIIHI